MGVYRRRNPSGEVVWYSRVQHQGRIYRAGPYRQRWRAEEESGSMHRAREGGTLATDYGSQAQGRPRRLPKLILSYREHRRQQVEAGERSASNLDHDLRMLDVIENHFGDVPLAEIGRPGVHGFKFARRADVKGATVNRYLAVASALFEHGVELDWIAENPVRGVRRFPEKPQTYRWLQYDEAAKLLDATKRGPRYLYPLVLTALYTGMRRGELLALEWRDVDLVRRCAEVVASKTSRRRVVPLHPEVVECLRRWKGKSPGSLVFAAADGKPLGNVRKAFTTAVKRARIPHVRFHDLRHTAASWMAQNGADLLQIMRVLGHASIDTTKRYAHLVQRNADEAVGRMPGLEEVATRTATPIAFARESDG